MKARTWFHALGQSHEARRVPYILQRKSMQPWPLWAKRAYCAGRLSVQHERFGDRVAAATDLIEAGIRQALAKPWPVGTPLVDRVVPTVCIDMELVR